MNRIKELRKARKLSQEQLANLVFVGQTAVSQWEKGKSFPSAETQGLLADVFGVSVDYLLGRVNDPKEKTPSEEGVKKGTIKIVGRDGSFVERELTDDQIDIVKRMIDQMPDFKN